MKAIKKKIISLLCICMLVVPDCSFAGFTEMPELSLDKCKKAEINLNGSNVTGNMMEMIGADSNDSSQESWSKVMEYAGRMCRETYVANKMMFRFDDAFAKPEDDAFLFVFDYWDYGGGGMYYLDYSSKEDPTQTTRQNVYKRGDATVGAKWRKEYVVVVGASFCHQLENNADFWIANRKDNAFANIEVYNLAPIKEELATMELGIFGESKAQILINLGLFSLNEGETVTTELRKQMSRQQAINYMITTLGLSTKAKGAGVNCSYKDVAEEYRDSVEYAKQIGILCEDSSELKADEIIKEKELIEYYLNYFGVLVDGDIIKTAEEAKLINSADYIFQPEKTAHVDNLMCLSYNALKIIKKGSEKVYFNELLDEGVLEFKTLMKSGDKEIVEFLLSEPVYCPYEEHTDPDTGRKWYCLNFFDTSIMRPYMTQLGWTKDNERFVFVDYNNFIYEYNIKTCMVKKIADRKPGLTYTSMTIARGTDSFYWVNPQNQLMKMDMNTYEETLIYQLGADIYKVGDLAVTNDETRISFDAGYINPEKGTEGRAAVVDVPSGELWLQPFHDFGTIITPGYYQMHSAINPVYKDILLYCSGANGVPVVNGKNFMTIRCWRQDLSTGYDGMFFEEYKAGEIPLGFEYGEQNTHESWTADGEYLLINKGSSSSGGYLWCNGYTGLALISKDGRDRKYLGQNKVEFKGKTVYFNSTHPGTSPASQRWAVADDGNYNTFYNYATGLVLRDTESAASYLLAAKIPCSKASDFHPHPGFSQDGNIVIFGVSDQYDKIGMIGWMDVSDIVNKPSDGQRIQLSDSCEALDFTGFEYDLDQVNINGEDAYKIPKGKKMYFDINNDVVWGRKKDVEISITYLDNGITPMKLEYILWNDNRVNTYLSKRSIQISRTGTGGWKTKKITLKGVNMDNMELLATDMKLSAVASDLVIKEITAEEYIKR